MLRYPIIDIIGFYLYRSGIDDDHDYNIIVSIMLQTFLVWRHTSHAVKLGCPQLSLLSIGNIIELQVCRLMVVKYLCVMILCKLTIMLILIIQNGFGIVE